VSATATVLAACGDSSPGLATLEQGGPESFDLRCGVTAIWEAGVVANVGQDPAVVTSVRLRKPPPGFSLEWARAKLAPVGDVQEQNADHELLGLRIPPGKTSLAELRDAASNARGWHLAVGIGTPKCERKPGSPPRHNVVGPIYEMADGELVVGYRLNGQSRTISVGHEATICTHPRAGECP
jgi:hypothetical protein